MFLGQRKHAEGRYTQVLAMREWGASRQLADQYMRIPFAVAGKQ